MPAQNPSGALIVTPGGWRAVITTVTAVSLNVPPQTILLTYQPSRDFGIVTAVTFAYPEMGSSGELSLILQRISTGAQTILMYVPTSLRDFAWTPTMVISSDHRLHLRVESTDPFARADLTIFSIESE